MSKITEDILSKIDIVDIVSRYVKLKRAGSNFSGLSPFQAEKTASFMVSPSKQIFKDFSSGLGGNVITFLMEVEKIDFWDAIKMLAKDANIDLKEYTDNMEKHNQYDDEKEKMKRLHKLAQEFFVDELVKNKNAYEYLIEKRKLDDKTIQLFGVGYAPGSSYGLTQYIKSKGFRDEDMLWASLTKKNQNGEIYPFFRNRITFPIYDRMQNIIGFSARVINPEDKPKYLNSSEHIAFEKSKILYGLNIAKQYVKEHDAIIIVEGQMDVIALSRLDIPIGVATCGTALTDQHIKLIKRYTENIYLSFDNDNAGQNASIRALKTAYQQGLYPKIFKLPSEFKDIDEFANNNGSKEELKKIIELSIDGYMYIFEGLEKKSDIKSPIDKQRILNVMFDLLAIVENRIIKDHYKQLLSERLGINSVILEHEYNKYNKHPTDKNKNQDEESKIKKHQPDRETLVASLFLDGFINQFIEDQTLRTSFLIIKDKIIEILPDSKFAQFISDPNHLTELQELQLRWENELNDGKEETRRIQIIKHLVGPVFKDYIQIIIKGSNVSSEDKQYLINEMKRVG